MLTGAEIDKNFDWKVDKSFSAYITNAAKNRLFRNTLFNLADKKWFGLNDQKVYDELSSMVSTEAAFLLNNNNLLTAPLIVTSISVTSGIYTVNTYFPHNLFTGDIVSFQRLTGNYVNLNGGSFTVTVTGPSGLQFTQGNSTFPALLMTGIMTHNKMCPDYLHMFSSKAKFYQKIDQVVPLRNNSDSPIRITTRYISSLRTGDKIVTDSFPIASMNGTFYVKTINSHAFDLFLDINLTQPTPAVAAGNASTGIVSRVYENYTIPVYSDRKIDPFTLNDVRNPGVEFAQKLIKVYPRTLVCQLLTMDYMKIPDPFIDVNDSQTDLELIYPSKFLYRLITEAAMIYSSPARDVMLQRDMQLEIIQNP